MANSVDPDQTAQLSTHPTVSRSKFALFAKSLCPNT